MDDETNIRLMLTATLSTEGYTIEEATHGREGLEAISRKRPDLVILDLSMPEIDGMGVLQAIKAMRPSHRPRVIVLTAYGSISAAVKATRLGAIDFLEKPVSPIEVREAVENALNEPINNAESAPLGDDVLAGGYEGVLDSARKSLRMARYTDAESLIMKAADLGHRDAAYFNLIGVLYESQRKWRLAKKFYGKALAEDKNYEPAKQNQLRVHELQVFGKTSRAVMLGDEPDIWFAQMP